MSNLFSVVDNIRANAKAHAATMVSRFMYAAWLGHGKWNARKDQIRYRIDEYVGERVEEAVKTDRDAWEIVVSNRWDASPTPYEVDGDSDSSSLDAAVKDHAKRIVAAIWQKTMTDEWNRLEG